MSFEELNRVEGVSLSFTTHNPKLNVSETVKESEAPSVQMRLRLEGREDVELPDGRSLKDAKWTLSICAKEALGTFENQKRVGVLGYFEGDNDYPSVPETCYIHLVLKQDNFNALLSAIKAGRSPDHVSVKVQGLKYGSMPDGSCKVWDVATNTNLSIIKFSFNIPLVSLERDSFDDVEEERAVANLPATSVDIRGLYAAIAEHIAATQFVGKSVIGIGALILLLWILSR